MKKNTNDSLGKNKKIKKGKYFETITTLSLSILFAFVVLVGTQSIMGAKTTTITENKAEKYYYDGKYDEAINEYMEMQKKETWPIWTVKTAEIYSIQGNLTKSNNLLKEAIIKRDKIMLEDGEKYLEQDKELINKVKEISIIEVERCLELGVIEWYVLKSNVKKAVENYIYEKTKRRPTIIPIIMET